MNRTNVPIQTGRAEEGKGQPTLDQQLYSALERIRYNAQFIFDKKPVRDWGETLSEADAALEAYRKDSDRILMPLGDGEQSHSHRFTCPDQQQCDPACWREHKCSCGLTRGEQTQTIISTSVAAPGEQRGETPTDETWTCDKCMTCDPKFCKCLEPVVAEALPLPATEEDEDICKICRKTMLTLDGLDPTPICNLCAQERVVELEAELSRLASVPKADQRGWIDCKQRLPTKTEAVIGFNVDSYLADKVWFDHDTKEFSSMHSSTMRAISHWMPLPQAPEVR